MKPEPISPDVIAAIEDVLQQEMLQFGMTSVDVRIRADHSGEPSLWIEAHYGTDGEPIDPRVMAKLTTKVRDRLWALGEERFPYIQHLVPDEKKVVELR